MNQVHDVASAKALLLELSRNLLRIHKHFVDSEKSTADHILGRTATPFDFLNLLVNDSRFAWMKPLSTFITELDVLTDGMTEVDLPRLKELKSQVETLLFVKTETNPSLPRRYEELALAFPSFVILHVDLKKLLARL